ncbi:MAG: hypothetical protein ACKOC5_03635, partial [Chloroflexota bacterium]
MAGCNSRAAAPLISMSPAAAAGRGSAFRSAGVMPGTKDFEYDINILKIHIDFSKVIFIIVYIDFEPGSSAAGWRRGGWQWRRK